MGYPENQGIMGITRNSFRVGFRIWIMRFNSF